MTKKQANEESTALVEKSNLPAAREDKPVALRQGTTSIYVKKPDAIDVYSDIEEEEDSGAVAVPESSQLGIFRILQNGSPQCQDVADGGLGVRPGTIYNTQTKQCFDGKRGIFIIVARTHLLYPEYIKREPDGTGGGFLEIHEPGSPEVKRAQDNRIKLYGDLRGPLPFGQTENGKDIELIETYYADCVCVLPNEDGSFPGEYGRVFRGSFPFSSTNIPVYTAWQEQQKGMTYPKEIPGQQPKLIRLKSYSHVWHLTTRLRKRGAQNWMIWSVALAGRDEQGNELPYEHSRLPRDSFLYRTAEDLRAELLEGAVNLDFAKDNRDTDSAGPPQGGMQDDIPFEN